MMTVSFPGGVAVEAHFGKHVVLTDQPEPYGTDAAMAPFDLFIASIATCMGFYALRFCQQRNLSTEGLDLELETIREPDGKRVAKIEVHLKTPKDFPEKYHDALLRAIDHCAVKKHLYDPPEFETKLVRHEVAQV